MACDHPLFGFFFVKIVFDSISNPCTKLSLDLRCEWIMISIENALTSRTWYTFILDWWQLLVLPRFIQWECTKAKLKKERIHTWSVCLRLLGAWEHDNCLECIDVRTWYHDLYDDTKHAHTLFCSLGGALSLAFFSFHFRDFVSIYWMCLHDIEHWRILWELYDIMCIKCQIIKLFARITCIVVLLLNTSIFKRFIGKCRANSFDIWYEISLDTRTYLSYFSQPNLCPLFVFVFVLLLLLLVLLFTCPLCFSFFIRSIRK